MVKISDSKESENNDLENSLEVLTLIDRPSCYLTPHDRWKLLGVLLTKFGANFSLSSNTLYLYWGLKNKKNFKIIQKLMNSILNTSVKGEYNKTEEIWTFNI